MLSCLQDVAIDNCKIDLVIIAMATAFRWHLPAPNMSNYNFNMNFIQHGKWLHTLNSAIRNWCVKHNVFDELEMTYRYFVNMWQIKTICDYHLECPVLFFNAWDREINNIDKMITDSGYYQSFIDLMETKFVKPPGFHKTQYIDAFLSIGEKKIGYFLVSPGLIFCSLSIMMDQMIEIQITRASKDIP